MKKDRVDLQVMKAYKKFYKKRGFVQTKFYGIQPKLKKRLK